MRMGLYRKFRISHYKPFRRKPIRVNLFFLNLFIASLVLFCICFAYQKMHPALLTLAENKAYITATQIIESSVNNVIKEKGIEYTDFVTVSSSDDGKVSYISADVLKINSLKSDLSIEIYNAILSSDESNIYIPLGFIFGNEFTSYLGPKIKVSLLPGGFPQTIFKNNFTTAGVNQTNHEIYLEVTANIALVSPTFNKSATFTTNVPIAQTVIVGNVPDQFVIVEDKSESGQDKVLDLIN